MAGKARVIGRISILVLIASTHAFSFTGVDIKGANAAGADSLTTDYDCTLNMPQGTTAEIAPGQEYELTGGGYGVGHEFPEDQCHFAYRKLHGDFDISAQIVSFENGSDYPRFDSTNNCYSMAGLMLRSSLDPADRQLCVYMLPECEQTLRDYSYSNLEYRYVPYGSSTSHPGSVRWISDDYWRREAFPNSTGFVSYPSVWVRLTRQGNTIRAYASDDGTTWTQIVKRFWKKGEIVAEFDDITDHDLPDELYAGLFVTAHNVSGGTVSATFDNVNGFDASGGEPQQIDHTVAVLGNSIADGWPRKYVPTRFGTILDSMLGNRIEVSTYGFPAYSVLRVETQGKTIYGENGPLSVAMAAKAQVYLVEFGPNAANIDNSPEAEAHFERDFSDMIDSLQNITPRPEIFVLLPLPATGEFHGIQPAILKDSIRPKMVKVAEEKGCRIIDLYPLFEGKPDRYYDVIHPNASGHYAIADVVYDSLDAYFQTTAVAPSSGTSAASRVSAGISCTRRGASLALHGREHETYTVSIFSLDGKLLQRSSKVSADGVLSLPREMARKAILVHIESITTPGRLVRSYIW